MAKCIHCNQDLENRNTCPYCGKDQSPPEPAEPASVQAEPAPEEVAVDEGTTESENSGETVIINEDLIGSEKD